MPSPVCIELRVSIINEVQAGATRRAVAERDGRADGHFVYAVRSTGVYCRPSCPSRAALPENVGFHASPEAAEAAGFPWAVHNIFDGLGIMDEATRRLDPAVAAALGLKAGP